MLRLRTYLTIASAIVFPLVILVWVRSYLYNDTVYRIGGTAAVMVDTIRGEIALWAGPIRQRADVVYQRETVESDYGLRTSDMLRLVPTSVHLGGFGFEYAEMDIPPLGWRNATGTVRCMTLPLWFLALLTGLLPARCIVNGMHWTTATAAGRCRRCRFLLSKHHLRCPECGEDVAPPATANDTETSSDDPPNDPRPTPTVLIKDPRQLTPTATRKIPWDVFVTGDRRRRRDLV